MIVWWNGKRCGTTANSTESTEAELGSYWSTSCDNEQKRQDSDFHRPPTKLTVLFFPCSSFFLPVSFSLVLASQQTAGGKHAVSCEPAIWSGHPRMLKAIQSNVVGCYCNTHNGDFPTPAPPAPSWSQWNFWGRSDRTDKETPESRCISPIVYLKTTLTALPVLKATFA